MTTDTVIIISGTSQGLGKSLYGIFENFDTIGINRRTISNNDLVINLSQKNISLNKLDKILPLYNRIIFISNASTIDPIQPIVGLKENDIETSIYTNYINPAKIVLKIVQCEKSYIILNMTTGAAFTSNSKLAMYSASKAAMHRYIDILKKEQINNSKAIYIDNYDPGRMNTKMQTNLISTKKLTKLIDSLNKVEDVALAIQKRIEEYLSKEK